MYIEPGDTIFEVGKREQEPPPLFIVTHDGRIERDGRDITDDDSALADCMRVWAKGTTGD